MDRRVLVVMAVILLMGIEALIFTNLPQHDNPTVTVTKAGEVINTITTTSHITTTTHITVTTITTTCTTVVGGG